MTPPAPAVLPTAAPQPRPASHLRALRVAAPAGWRCDNCELPNAARRRRCSDCGTSRD